MKRMKVIKSVHIDLIDDRGFKKIRINIIKDGKHILGKMKPV